MEQDYNMAYKYWVTAAEAGLAVAQMNVAMLLEKGQGVKQNNEKALEYYKMSSKQGFAQAQVELGKQIMINVHASFQINSG